MIGVAILVRLRPEGLERWVVNLTNRQLQPAQQKVLRLGLNFSPTPNKIPVKDTFAGVEEAARRLPEEEANDLRIRVSCGILRKAKPPRRNITREQEKALKELRKLEDESVIIPADNGNATVILTYHQS